MSKRRHKLLDQWELENADELGDDADINEQDESAYDEPDGFED